MLNLHVETGGHMRI